MRVLVVGGTRFFGIPMVERLLEDGHDVTIATRGNADVPFADRTHQIALDRGDYDSVHEALTGHEFDVIIDKIAYCSNDVRNLLENVRCQRYIQMSSCAVYPRDHEMIMEEEFDPAHYELIWGNRTEDYAEGKRQAERAALEYLPMAQCTFVRYPVVLGPHDYTGRLRFYVEHVAKGLPMYVDDLNCSMPFIQEEEAGIFLAHLVNQIVCGPIHASSIGSISPWQIIEFAEQNTGRRAILEAGGDPAPYNGASANVSYVLSKAESTGFAFTELNDWIFALLQQHQI